MEFINKITRPKKLDRSERQRPNNIEQLLRQYDLTNKHIYDYLDELVVKLNNFDINVNDFIDNGTISADRIKGGKLVIGNIQSKTKMLSVSDAKNNTEYIEGIVLQNGNELIKESGIVSNLQFGQFDRKDVGYSTNYFPTEGEYLYINIPFFIPENFTITSAKVSLYHAPIKWQTVDETIWGYCRNLKLYIRNENTSYYKTAILSSESHPENDLFDTEIENAFGENGFTATIPTDENHSTENIISIDIKNFIETNKNIVLQIRTSNQIPELNPDILDVYQRNYLEQTGSVIAILHINGFMKGEI